MKVSADIRCPLCDWGARHTSTSINEVIEFLSRLRANHLADEHPTRLPSAVFVFTAIKPEQVER